MKRLITLIITIASIAILSAKVTAPSLTGRAGGGSSFTTRTYPLSDFTEINVSNVVKVIYTQGDKYNVQLKGRTDWLDLMEVTSEGGILYVRAKKTKKFDNVKKKDQPDGEHNFILFLTAPCLEVINLRGVSSFEGKRLTPDWLNVRLEGVSKFKADAIECAKLDLIIKGVSKVAIGSIDSPRFSASVMGSSNADIQQLKAKEFHVILSGASKANLPKVTQAEKSSLSLNGASKLTLLAEVSDKMDIGLSGASNGELTFKGGSLRTVCTGASKLNADVNCTAIHANCDGASKTYFSGTADKVEIDRSGVAVNIDTSRLNQF